MILKRFANVWLLNTYFRKKRTEIERTTDIDGGKNYRMK